MSSLSISLTVIFHLKIILKLKAESVPNVKVVSANAVQFSFQMFNAARQLSHIEAAPDKSGLVLLEYWVGLKRCLVIIHN